MKYIILKDQVYYENEINETILKKGTIVTYNSNYSKDKCFVNANNLKYLVNKKDLIIK